MYGGSYAKGNYGERIYDVVVMGGLTNGYSNIEGKINGIPAGYVRDIARKLYENTSVDYCKTLDLHLEEILRSMKIADEIIKK